MSEYITKEKAVEIIEQRQKELCPVGRYGRNYVYGSDREKYDSWEEIIDEIENMDAADVVEVRHGRWGEYESFPLTSSLNGHPCSECGMHFSTLAIPVMKYCPNCGARMDKEDEHEAD